MGLLRLCSPFEEDEAIHQCPLGAVACCCSRFLLTRALADDVIAFEGRAGGARRGSNWRGQIVLQVQHVQQRVRDDGHTKALCFWEVRRTH